MGKDNSKAIEIFDYHAPWDIISYDFDYEDGSFMYLDQARTLRRAYIYKLTLPEDRIDWEPAKLKLTNNVPRELE